jgi:hypothetical protein
MSKLLFTIFFFFSFSPFLYFPFFPSLFFPLISLSIHPHLLLIHPPLRLRPASLHRKVSVPATVSASPAPRIRLACPTPLAPSLCLLAPRLPCSAPPRAAPPPMPPHADRPLHRGQSSKRGGRAGWSHVFVAPPPQWKSFAAPPPTPYPEPQWSSPFGKAPPGAGVRASFGALPNRVSIYQPDIMGVFGSLYKAYPGLCSATCW